MDETIKLLREQTVLCAHLPELFDELINVMKNNSPDVQEPIRKIETVMRDLNKNESKAQEFLKRVNAASFTEYLSTQEKNIKRDVAEKLLRKAADSQRRLRVQVGELKILLQQITARRLKPIRDVRGACSKLMFEKQLGIRN